MHFITALEYVELKELSTGYNIHMSPLSISITIQVRMEDDKITTFNGHVLCYDYDCLPASSPVSELRNTHTSSIAKKQLMLYSEQ